ANQKWSIDYASYPNERIRGPGNRCVQLASSTPGEGVRLELRNCGSATEQHFHAGIITTSFFQPHYVGKGEGTVSHDANYAYFLTMPGEFCDATHGAAIRRLDMRTGVDTIWNKGCAAPAESQSDGTRLYYIDWNLDA